MEKIISNKNIRATSLDEFWGKEYPESIYLWEGAKHNLPLQDIINHPVPTLHDQFSTGEKINEAHDYCKKLYYKFIPLLTKKLNEIHSKDFPESFWITIFGYWLFRHICITYDKFIALSQIDIDSSSINLLHKKCFYIPDNHVDYLHYFAYDFGVQQLVSHYYYLFSKTDHPVIKSKFKFQLGESKPVISLFDRLKKTIKNIYYTPVQSQSGFDNSQIALCGLFYTSDVKKELYEKSNGRIKSITPASVNTDEIKIDFKKRKKLTAIKSENNYEKYFFETLFYCFPKKLLEQFIPIYKIFHADIIKSSYKYIVSEDWMSNLNTSIHSAIAQKEGKKIILNEHAASQMLFEKNMMWMEFLAADKYITTGWKVDESKFIQGSLLSVKIIKYEQQSQKKNILFISHIRLPYLFNYTGHHLANSTYVTELKIVEDFINLLPARLKNIFQLRVRRSPYFWDTEKAWQVKEKKIELDEGMFSKSITESRIVIIDHLSTGFAEILLSGVPCLVIHEKSLHPISKKYQVIIDRLYDCKVFHDSAQSAMSHLNLIYDNVYEWWNKQEIQDHLLNLISEMISDSSDKTTKYLLSYLEE
ncbi:MAG: hypothetical protein HY841_11240 [Bacteroidetes bacterium]|nr:hypothetical protein [Bacteroidota bacterium]